MKWEKLSNILKEIYQEQNILEYFIEDEKYLKNAFEVTETLWMKQYEKIANLKIVMISEAPLFGKEQTYIYNPNTPTTVFFHFKDLEAFFAQKESLEKPKTVEEQKNILYDIFSKNGFLTLDIFPFALNPKHTKLHYRNISKKLYQKLLQTTTREYLIPKLELCLKKSDKDTHFVYRYKRLFDKTESHFEKVLNELSVQVYQISSIHGTNMSLNREKLRRLLQGNNDD